VIADEQRPVPGWAQLYVGGHPLPTPASVEAGTAALAFVGAVRPDETVVALISGGGSSLMDAPHPGLDIADVRTVVDQLIRSGAPIGDINGVRRKLSMVKAGGLARACPGTITTVLLSDVARGHPSEIASGPTVQPKAPDRGIAECFVTYGITGPSAARVLEFVATTPPHPPVVTPPPVIVGSGTTAGSAIVDRLATQGISARYITDQLDGDATAAARWAVESTASGEVGIFTGETTVSVTGTGNGGRNQHAALVAACEIVGTGTRLLAAGTDGIDGPTQAAGAVVDGGTVADLAAARQAIDAFDSSTYLAATHSLITTGRTGTNVGDIWIVDKRH
jgi:glycerate 2-kinase